MPPLMHVLADIMRIQREETICLNNFFIEIKIILLELRLATIYYHLSLCGRKLFSEVSRSVIII